MAYSSDVSTGDQALASQYNTLRDDIDNFVELDGQDDKGTTGAGAWEDWDISGIVPTGTKYVLVAMGNLRDGTTQIIGARKNGSALARLTSITWTDDTDKWSISVVTECDTNRIIEIYSQNLGAINGIFNILGYWKGIGL